MSVAYFILAAAAASSAAKQSDDLSIQALHNFGICVAERSPRGVRAALDLDYRSKDYDDQMMAVLKGNADECMISGQMKASPMLYAGSIAEAMLKSEFKSADLGQLLAYDPARQVIQARSSTETMALCTVLNAPQATSRLLASEPTTKEETEAMNVIGPVLGECLKKDTKLTLNKPALRSLLALAAWRIATTPKAAS
jgi:hypothetical protein